MKITIKINIKKMIVRTMKLGIKKQELKVLRYSLPVRNGNYGQRPHGRNNQFDEKILKEKNHQNTRKARRELYENLIKSKILLW